MHLVRERLKPLLLLLILALGAPLAGCSGKPSASPEERGPRHPQVYEGSFVEALDRIYAAPYVSACDTSRKTRVYALARDLDARKTDLDAAAARILPAGHTRALYGTFGVLESSATTTHPDRWDSETDGWDLVFESYATAASETDWENLRSHFGGIVSDDLARTKWGMSFATGRTDGPLLDEAERDLLRCYRDPACARPAFPNPAVAAWIARQPYYAKLLAEIGAKEHPSEAVELVGDLMNEIRLDRRSYFGMRANASIRAADGTSVNVPMDPGGFREIATHLTKYIEPFWKSEAFTATIRWANSGTPDVFRMILGEGPTGRAFVSYTRKEMTVFSNLRAKTLAHEFGHVLGLPDRYYTVWDEASCTYTTEYNLSDLMSSSRTGQVTPADFALLARQYLAAPAP